MAFLAFLYTAYCSTTPLKFMFRSVKGQILLQGTHILKAVAIRVFDHPPNRGIGLRDRGSPLPYIDALKLHSLWLDSKATLSLAVLQRQGLFTPFYNYDALFQFQRFTFINFHHITPHPHSNASNFSC